MKRYALTLSVLMAVIVLPAVMMRLSGTHTGWKTPWAALQMFALLPLLMTMPVSLVLMGLSLMHRRFVSAIWALVAMMIPALAWYLSALSNPHGWEAAMGI